MNGTFGVLIWVGIGVTVAGLLIRLLAHNALPTTDPRQHLKAAEAQIARGREGVAIVRDAATQVERHLDAYEQAISTAHQWEDSHGVERTTGTSSKPEDQL